MTSSHLPKTQSSPGRPVSSAHFSVNVTHSVPHSDKRSCPCRSLCRWPEPQTLPRAVISLPRCRPPPPPPVVPASHSEASSYKGTNVHWWDVWILAVRTPRVYVQSQTPPGQTSSRIFCYLFMQHHMIFSTPVSKNTLFEA